MTHRSVFWLALLIPLAPLSAERPAINDKRAPQGREDLEEIQRLYQQALPAARAATVCIELGEGSGSGVVVSEDGLIMTAAHVTGGVDREFTVRFEDGRKVKAKSLGLNSENDAALAQIVEEGSYPHVPIEKTDRTRLGDWVFALGHSGGFDKARGSVARLGRLVRTANSTYQSDCNLIGGDSGGPLFDLTGALIGIHSRVGARLPENMHVPTRVFLENWDAMQGGEFIGEGPFAQMPKKGKGFLGLLAEAHDGEGIRVKRVGRESPAEAAGIREGDILLEMNGQPLTSRDDLQALLEEMAPEDKATFELVRDGKRQTLSLKLGDRDA